MYSGSEFQREEAAAGKARLPTVDNLIDGTMRRVVAAERRFRRPGMSATRVSGPGIAVPGIEGVCDYSVADVLQRNESIARHQNPGNVCVPHMSDQY